MTTDRRHFLIKAGALAVAPLFQTVSSPAAALSGMPPQNGAARFPQLLPDAVSRTSELGLDPRLWTWLNADANANAMAKPANYYEASLTPWANFGPLETDRVCDVVVIGGGLLGASTALHLAEAGVDTILVEKRHIGSGASGRNGGQLVPGLARWEASNMIANLSTEDAKRLWRFSADETMATIDAVIARYGVNVDRRRGHLTAAVHPGHIASFVEAADARRMLGDKNIRVIGKEETREHVRSQSYFGASIDAMGGQIHPLGLLRTLAAGFVKQGGTIYEQTAVAKIESTPTGSVVITDRGTVRARRAVVLAVHNRTFEFLPGASTTVPFFSYVAVTAPLPIPVAQLLPTDVPVYDTQLQIDYYRRVAANRLLFGGQGTGTPWQVRDVNRYLTKRIRSVFPQLGPVNVAYSWSGVTDLTLNGATDARKSADAVPLYLVHGWSGHGVSQTVHIGKSICDDITGANGRSDFTMLTQINHVPLPLGRNVSPVAIPLIKGALHIMNALRPAEMLSF